MKKIDSRVSLFGIEFFGNSKASLLSKLDAQLTNSRKLSYIATPNSEQIMQSREDKEFLQALQKADICIPDGAGVVLASRILALKGKSKSIKQTMPGVDLVSDVLALSREKKLKVLLLGGRDYDQPTSKYQLETEQVGGISLFKLTADSFELNWLETFQNVKQPTRAEDETLRQVLKVLKPDVVFVAFGAPWQEKWIANHLELLKKSKVKLVMAVGGSFDYLLGKVPRAPAWLRQLGLEWLYRLIKQPWRWRRQLRLIKFVSVVVQEFFSS